jgi:hypothetical protein
LKFEKRSQFFVGGDDESLSVVAVCISNEDRLSVGINRCDAPPTPTGFAEIVSDDFPELHVDRIVPLLVSTQQSQNDMKGGANDAGFRAELNKRAMRAWRGLCRIIRHNSPMTPLLSGDCERSHRIRRNNSVKYYGKIPSISR